jgi:pimeloyl-ACP methyl ester carboxylesterase
VRWGRWLKRLLVLLVALWVGFAFGYVPYRLAGVAVDSRRDARDRENGDLTPASFGLEYEPVSFAAADGVDLSGWWVPAAENRGTVVLIHGLNRRRIEMVSKVPFLNQAGWNALLFDLRRHGESGGSKRGLGFFEKRDAEAAVQWARQRSSRPVVVWGVSLGGATATLAAAEDRQIAGLICDSSFRSLPDTLRHHIDLFRRFHWSLRLVPSWPTSEIALFWIGRRGGFDPAAVDVEAAAGMMGSRPCLFVCNEGDRRMPSQIAFDLQAAAGPQAQVLVVPGESHGGAYREGTAPYQRAVQDLLEQVLAAEEAMAPATAAAATGSSAGLGGAVRASVEAGS